MKALRIMGNVWVYLSLVLSFFFFISWWGGVLGVVWALFWYIFSKKRPKKVEDLPIRRWVRIGALAFFIGVGIYLLLRLYGIFYLDPLYEEAENFRKWLGY